MPLYDFLCPSCGHKFSKMIPLGLKETPCHICNATAKKLISLPAVHFVGSGFYSSDNKTKKKEIKEKEKKKQPEKKKTPKKSIKEKGRS
jgi:putative FmdB family regulatory protein